MAFDKQSFSLGPVENNAATDNPIVQPCSVMGEEIMSAIVFVESRHRKPICVRCGDPATRYLAAHGKSEFDAEPLCSLCFPLALRAATQPEYRLTDADRERARQEIEERASASGRLMTETLVIEGNRIRFKKPKDAPLVRSDNGSSRERFVSVIDDPFDFEEE